MCVPLQFAVLAELRLVPVFELPLLAFALAFVVVRVVAVFAFISVLLCVGFVPFGGPE